MTDKPSTPQEALAHFGVKGMHWGARKSDYPGASRSTNREAKKDAQEFARAKMFYGQGAGTRRKLIKATVDAKSKKDPTYKAAFKHHLAQQDMSKHASKARGERKRKDVTSGTAKTARGVHRSLTGGFGTVSATSALIAGGVVYAHKTGIDKTIFNSAKTAMNDLRKPNNMKVAEDFLKKMGM